MKKLTLSIGLIAAILSAKAQDTTCTYFKGKNVYEFDYYMDTVLNLTKQTTKFYNINVEHGSVLCLHLSDNKERVRKVITTFFDGSTVQDVFDSQNAVYYAPKGVIKVSVGRPRLAVKL